MINIITLQVEVEFDHPVDAKAVRRLVEEVLEDAFYEQPKLLASKGLKEIRRPLRELWLDSVAESVTVRLMET